MPSFNQSVNQSINHTINQALIRTAPNHNHKLLKVIVRLYRLFSINKKSIDTLIYFFLCIYLFIYVFAKASLF